MANRLPPGAVLSTEESRRNTVLAKLRRRDTKRFERRMQAFRGNFYRVEFPSDDGVSERTMHFALDHPLYALRSVRQCKSPAFFELPEDSDALREVTFDEPEWDMKNVIAPMAMYHRGEHVRRLAVITLGMQKEFDLLKRVADYHVRGCYLQWLIERFQYYDRIGKDIASNWIMWNCHLPFDRFGQ